LALEIFWRLPPEGDGRSIAPQHWHRGDYTREKKAPHPFARTGAPRDGYNYYDVLLQIGRAAELNGFDGLWIPESPSGEAPLIVAGSLAREVPRLKLVPTLRAPLMSAVYATKIANSFQRLTGGRLGWNLSTVEDREERPWHGRRFTESEQVARTSEFLDVAKGFWNQAPFTYEGKYYEVVDGGFAPALQGENLPRVYISGSSDEAIELSARHADVHVLQAAPLEEVKRVVERLNALAAARGRSVAVALESDVIARYTDEDAWADARLEWAQATANTVPISPSIVAVPDFDSTRLGQNLWSGFGALRPGASVGLVGGFAEIKRAIDDYADAGVSTLILGANPHLEEAYRLGEHLVPFIRRRDAESVRRAS
jgi:alkanesulfonate monooxygenase